MVPPARSLAAVQPTATIIADDPPIDVTSTIGGGAPAELLCADRYRDTGCSSWQCQRSVETRWLWCKGTCGACDLLRKAIAADTGLRVMAVHSLGPCKDEHPDCKGELGAPQKCGEDTHRMLKLCQASCGFCAAGAGAASSGSSGRAARLPRPGAPEVCADDLSLCPFLEQRGLCTNSSAWIDTQCRLSCKLCSPEGAAGAAQQGRTLPLQRLRAIQLPSECKDYHSQCEQWARNGQCRSNPSFMNAHCRASCDPCGKGPAGGEGGTWRQQQAPGGRGEGAVPRGAAPMVKVPVPPPGQPEAAGAAPGTNKAPAAPPPPSPALPAQAGVPPMVSDAWRPYHLCGSTSLETDGTIECTRLDSTLIKPCANRNPECHHWASKGECDSNPVFMWHECKASCASACDAYSIGTVYDYLTLGKAANATLERRRRVARIAAQKKAERRTRRFSGGDEKSRGQEPTEDAADGDEDKDEDEEELEDGQVTIVNMPVIGYGTAGLGEQTTERVGQAMDVGYAMIDTAEARDWYREDLVAKGMRKVDAARERVFLISKLHPRDHGRGATRAAFQRVLRDLSTDYLDLFLIHYPTCNEAVGCSKNATVEGTWRDSWREMEALYQEGKIRMIGASNFNSTELLQLLDFAKVKPAVLQARSDPLDVNHHLINLCHERGVVFMSYSLLGTQWVKAPGETNPVLNHKVIQAVAKDAQRSPAQVVIRWALQRGMAVIPRAGSVAHMEENLKALDFELDEDDMRKINQLDGTHRRTQQAKQAQPLTGQTRPLTGRAGPLTGRAGPLAGQTGPLTGQSRPLTGQARA